MNIVITGASNGIGYELAKLLAGEGHRVFAMARGAQRLEKLAKEASGEIVPVVLDLADSASRASACAVIAAGTRQVDVLVHNAGLLVNKPFAQLEEKDWQSVYQVNVFGAADLTRRLLPLFHKGSHVLHISSMGGVQGSQKFPGLAAYSSAKAAVATLAECLAEEFRAEGIAVNCLALGSVETEMFAAAFPGGKAGMKAGEMARFIGYFALHGGRYFNGKVLPVTATTP